MEKSKKPTMVLGFTPPKQTTLFSSLSFLLWCLSALLFFTYQKEPKTIFFFPFKTPKSQLRLTFLILSLSPRSLTIDFFFLETNRSQPLKHWNAWLL